MNAGYIVFIAQCVSLRLGLGGLRSMASQAVVIHVTAPDNKIASELSQKLVENKLAACVQTIPGMQSNVGWRESPLLLKEVLTTLPAFAYRHRKYILVGRQSRDIEGASAAYKDQKGKTTS